MTNTNARKKTTDLIHAAFVAAGLKDGVALSAEQLKTTADITFWRTGSTGASTRATYVTYSIAGTDAAVRGDDKTLLRENTVAIDVFSKSSFESKTNAQLLASIETALAVAGFEVEFEPEQYENDTTLYHQPITAFKIF